MSNDVGHACGLLATVFFVSSSQRKNMRERTLLQVVSVLGLLIAAAFVHPTWVRAGYAFWAVVMTGISVLINRRSGYPG